MFSHSIDEHISRLGLVFHRLQEAGLKIKPKKCSLLQTSVSYLGFTFTADGVKPDNAKFSTIKNWPLPQSVSEIRSFLGFASYYRRFVPNFSTIAAPLHRLSRKHAVFSWSDQCAGAFNELRAQLMSPPILAYPDTQKQFILDTDASDVGMGAVLSQLNDSGQEVVIAYASQTLSKSQRNQGSTRKELLAVVTFVTHFKHYLLGAQFLLRTDHKALVWLNSFRDTDGILARWIERLAAFDYIIQHRPGKHHTNADALSRIPSVDNPAGKSADTRIAFANAVATSAPAPADSGADNAQWYPSYSKEELHSAQLADPDLTIIIGWQEALLDRPLRSDPATRSVSLGVLRLWSQWKRLTLVDGVLYRQYYPEGEQEPVLQLVVPQSLQESVLRGAHSDVSGGHLGIEKTLSKLRRRYYWPFMSTSVADYCKACDVCASRKSPVPHPHAPLVQDHPSFPLEKVAIDIMGPLPVTARGNKYLVVICDYFTKWTEAFPVPDIRAETVATVLIDGFFCRYGVPYQLHSDRGSQFESKLFQQICELLDIRKSRTTAYHPQSDGLVERMNRTLEAMLSAHVNAQQSDWDVHLQRCLLAYRSSVHSSTKETPARLMFGREVTLPVDLMFNAPAMESTSVSNYVSKLKCQIQQSYQHARDAGAIAQQRQKTLYDKSSAKPRFGVGDLVSLHSPAIKPGTTSKFHRPWKGPFTILELIDDVVYRIADQSGVPQTVHVDRLKKFSGSSMLPSTLTDMPRYHNTSHAVSHPISGRCVL